MATNARGSAADFGRTPDYETANAAIDTVLANAAFKQKGTNLRKQYKQAEKKMDFASKEAKAAAERAAKFGLNVEQTGAGIQSQNERYTTYGKNLSERVAKFNQYTKQNTITVVDPETGKKKKVVNLTGQAYNDWQERQRRLQIEQARYNAQGKDLRTQSQSYNSSLAQARAVQARAEKKAARYQRLYDSYIARYRRYKRYSQYVPYRPA